MNPVGGEKGKEVINANSCILSIFQDGPHSFKDSATLKILFGLLNEPAFAQLRTQE